LNSIDVDSTKHGAICLYSGLSSFQFSPDESQLLYVADKKIKTESYFKESNLFKEKIDEKDEKSKDEKVKGNEYEWKQDWGEQLEGIKHTCVCILTLSKDNEYKLKIIELPNLSLAQPFWIDNQTIGFIAYQESPKRLGLIYCSNRVFLDSNNYSN
jgi:acylaminoacyl-peptidase